MSRKTIALITASLLAASFATTGLAEDLIAPLGLYVGGAFGRANVRVTSKTTFNLFHFDEPHAGWKAMLGVRPIAPLGGEFEYIDFGHPETTIGGVREDARARAFAAFAVGYLPIPVVDVFAKAGIARLQVISKGTQVTGQPTGGTCNNSSLDCIFSNDHTENRFAYGAGAQVKINRLGIRAEYERISASGGDPSFYSLGLTWTF